MGKLSQTVIAGLMFGSIALGSLPAWADMTYSPYIDWRERNQQRRIEEGVNNGTISPQEFNRLERQERRIARVEARMKADGFLTRGERTRLNRMLNRSSRNVYRAKRN